MKIFGFTVIRFPQAERHEASYTRLVNTIEEQRESYRRVIADQLESLEQKGEAITASIKVQQDDLTRLNALRNSLATLRSSL